ncbi:MAG: DUF3990 domain-containing protein [Alkaliphilus sp.]
MRSIIYKGRELMSKADDYILCKAKTMQEQCSTSLRRRGLFYIDNIDYTDSVDDCLKQKLDELYERYGIAKTLYHGSIYGVVTLPKIYKRGFFKDFAYGFYTTEIFEQAKRWAARGGSGYVSEYEYNPDSSLDIKIFSEVNEEWLDFIIHCRRGGLHNYDIVEGPMADDKIWNYIELLLDDSYEFSRVQFMAIAKFSYPTHQMVLCSEKSLKSLNYVDFTEVG